MKKLLVIATVAVVAVPVAEAQTGPSPNANDRARAAKVCKNVNAAIGSRAFRATFAPRAMSARAAMRNCARKQAREEAENRVNAAQQCREERGTTPASQEAFALKYGTEESNYRNAFGKCVSQHAREESEEDEDDLINAAQACRQERGTTPASQEAFAQKYGTEAANYRNAFGKCVSKLAQAQNDD